MNRDIYSVITGTGSYIPSKRIRNEDFLSNEFYDLEGNLIINKANKSTIQIGSLLQGIYLLEIKDQNTGKKVIERILKGT